MKDLETFADITTPESAKRSGRKRSVVLFVFLLALYIAASLFTFIASRSTQVFTLGDHHLPATAFTGVFSSLANICLIFIVVFFKRKGFITSLVILLMQFPMLLVFIVARKNMSVLPGFFGNIFTIIAIIMIYRRNLKIEQYQKIEIRHLKEQKRLAQHLFEQTATSLVNAIDAKDTYSRGHSVRVAEYSEKIARAMGKSDEECYKIYYAALLHDVGKIGIDDDIINKKGKLTDDEYNTIKQHPVFGNQILSSISEYPYLSIGAHYHHERYDGKGYPEKLKGNDIPEIARIIAVADAYDAMTSTRSYRAAIPQQNVREEIIKNSGTQFDPEIAKIMQHIIDMDTEYNLKERSTVQELAGKSELHCKKYRDEVSGGILLMPWKSHIQLRCDLEDPQDEAKSVQSIILFDSLDGYIHKNEQDMQNLNYFEYCEIFFDGRINNTGARKIQTNVVANKTGKGQRNLDSNGNGKRYDVEAVRFKDHALIKIIDESNTLEVTVVFPDNARYSYMSFTGQNTHFFDVHIRKSDNPVDENYIPRIAEEISYIQGPEGDIPNIQIDGFRFLTTKGIAIKDGMRIEFHSMSLPTARLIWHCPYIDVFHSADGVVHGEDYREYALVRLDGENWNGDGKAESQLTVEKTESFKDWDDWKRQNKEGIDCVVTFARNGNTIIVTTENLGLVVTSTITIQDGMEEIYAALTGDQCALTNIRIING